ncbi:hypothetical protein [Lentilactobacillus hilgardii]|uniref:hypothetical protein n=1 Tax=Lentilactobacillus hilgardii TaxID=1588 RepID=UPI0021A4FDCD|nr:hypothetical protein [Lentilactobacillus hilgardii]MCT3400163.1 hypothetical protein [Lentilactobacillus hilgardii]
MSDIFQELVYFKVDPEEIKELPDMISEVLTRSPKFPYFTVNESNSVCKELLKLSRPIVENHEFTISLFLNTGRFNTKETPSSANFVFSAESQETESNQSFLPSLQATIMFYIDDPEEESKLNGILKQAKLIIAKEYQNQSITEPKDEPKAVKRNKQEGEKERVVPPTKSAVEPKKSLKKETVHTFYPGKTVATNKSLPDPHIAREFREFPGNNQEVEAPGPLDDGYISYAIRKGNDQLNEQLAQSYSVFSNEGYETALKRKAIYQKILNAQKLALEKEYLDPQKIESELEKEFEKSYKEHKTILKTREADIEETKKKELDEALKEYQRIKTEIEQKHQEAQNAVKESLKKQFNQKEESSLRGYYDVLLQQQREKIEQEFNEFYKKIQGKYQEDIAEINRENRELTNEVFEAYKEDQKAIRAEMLQDARDTISLAKEQYQARNEISQKQKQFEKQNVQETIRAAPNPTQQPQIKEIKPEKEEKTEQAERDKSISAANWEQRLVKKLYFSWKRLKKRNKTMLCIGIAVVVIGTPISYVVFHKPSYSSLLQQGEYEQAVKYYPTKKTAIENVIYKGVTQGSASSAKEVISFDKSHKTTTGEFDGAVINSNWKKAYQIYNRNKKRLLKYPNRLSVIGYVLLKNGFLTDAKAIAKKANDSTLNEHIKAYEQLAEQYKNIKEQKQKALQSLAQNEKDKQTESSKKKKDNNKIKSLTNSINQKKQELSTYSSQMADIQEKMSKI